MGELGFNANRRALAATGLAGLAGLVALILLVRLDGSTGALSVWWSLLAGLVLAALSGGAMVIAVGAEGWFKTIGQRLLGALAIGLVTSTGIVATTRGMSAGPFAIATCLSLLSFAVPMLWAVGELRKFRVVVRIEWVGDSDDSGTVLKAKPLAPAFATASGDSGQDTDGSAGVAPLSDGVDQTAKRWSEEGRDLLEVCQRVQFEAGQQTAVVHVPIQPPMATAPVVECEPVGSEDLRITVDPVQPYGVRIVCRRPSPWNEAGEAVIAILVSAEQAAVRKRAG